MNIFNKTIDQDVRGQLTTRERILSNRDGQYNETYRHCTHGKNTFIRLTSGVDIINDTLIKYFNIGSQDDLATHFILEGGTLFSDINQPNIIDSFQRRGFGSQGGAYGSAELGGRSDVGIRPMPGITGMDIKSYGDKIATLRMATISIDCHDIHQLEALELLYMRPGCKVMLEWGNTTYFDSETTINPLQNTSRIDVIKKYKKKHEIYEQIKLNREKHNFNYDGMLAVITNFSWETLPNGSYKCIVNCISEGGIIDSLVVNNSLISGKKPLTDKDDKSNDANKNTTFNISNTLINILEKIKEKTKSDKLLRSNVILNDIYNLLDLKINNQKTSDIWVLRLPLTVKSDTPSTTTLNYITLKDLISIINETCIMLEGDRPVVFINKPGLCLSDPYQISINPYCCLISPYDNTGFKTIINYGDEQDNRFPGGLDYHLTQNFPYRNNQTSSLSKEYEGEMSEILIEFGYIKSIFESLINDDNDHKVILKDFLLKMMEGISSSIGGINSFEVIPNESNDSEIDIIDYNYIKAEIEDSYHIIPLMGVGNDGSGATYVRSYRMSTSLTNDIATTVSINTRASSQPSIDGIDNSVYRYFTQGITDRLKENFSSPVSAPLPVSSSLEKLFPLVDEIKNGLTQINLRGVSLAPDQCAYLIKPLNELIQYSKLEKELSKQYSFNTHTPIPLNLSITMDGISGLKVGNIFKIPQDRLPFQYKFLSGKYKGKARVGFIIWGINHNISIGEGWTTTIECKMVPFHFEDTGSSVVLLENKPILPTQRNVFKTVRVRNIVPNYDFPLYENNSVSLVLEYYFNNEPKEKEYRFRPLKPSENGYNEIKKLWEKESFEGYKVIFYQDQTMYLITYGKGGFNVFQPHPQKSIFDATFRNNDYNNIETESDLNAYTLKGLNDVDLYKNYSIFYSENNEYSKSIYKSSKEVWYNDNGELHLLQPTVKVPPININPPSVPGAGGILNSL